MSKTKAALIILFLSFIYGTNFIIVKIASNSGISSSFIVFIRGVFFLLCSLIIFRKSIKNIRTKELIIGSVAGLLNFGGYYFQTLGLNFTTPSNNAFLTGTNAFFVPLIAYLIYKISPSKRSFIAVPVGLLGIAFLTGLNNIATMTLNIGDIYSIVCAVIFAGLIVYLGQTASRIDFKIVAIMMAFWQTIGGFTAYILSNPQSMADVNILTAVLSLSYLGIVCSFFATSVQVFAQKFVSSTTTVLILSLQGVFAGLLSVLLKLETFSYSLLIGGMLIMASVLILEVKFKPKKSTITKL